MTITILPAEYRKLSITVHCVKIENQFLSKLQYLEREGFIIKVRNQ